MESGFFYPGLTTKKDDTSEWYIHEIDNGRQLCGITLAYCKAKKWCRTGMLVDWHEPVTTVNSTNQKIENKALLTCTNHCLAKCPSWDKTCKACGGTIDKTVLYSQKNTNTGVKDYFRQCNCDSAFKAAGMSAMAVLFVLFNVKYNA